MHGSQPGDPAKAGAAIVAAVESDEPPAFLLLGQDALFSYRHIVERRAKEVATWESHTNSTSLDV